MSSEAGRRGEQAVAILLRYEGWDIVEAQPIVHGHHLDFRAKHADHGEALVEVKVWENPATGRDTVKKAIADAYDLRSAGETLPYILVLSHSLNGLHRDMLARAVAAGVISEVRILGLGLQEFS